MKRFVNILILSCVSLFLVAQEYDKYILLEGTIVTSDSLSIANVHLVSYNTLRVFTTDKNGNFKILIDLSDSLKTEHISFESRMIYPSKIEKKMIYVLADRINQISEISVVHESRAVKNMNDNMSIMMNQLKSEYHSQHSTGITKNPYNLRPVHMNNFVEVNLFDLIDRIKHWKKNRE